MIKEFDIYVYDRDLNFVCVIDGFSSLRWRRKYYEAGEFELHIPIDNNVKRALTKDNILIRSDSVENGIIEAWQIRDDGEKTELTIIGRFLSSILDRRIIKKKINFNGKILDGERKILSEMTPFLKLKIKNADLENENIIFQATYKNVYSYLNKLAKKSTIAHRIRADIENKQYIYENYQGIDRSENQKINSRYEFSEDKSNTENAEYTFDSKNEKNCLLIGGEGQGQDRTIVEINDKNCTDFDLKEGFVNASYETKDENSTDSEYKEILRNKGYENLLEPIESIEVTTYATDYKKGWDLGDIVNIKKESWGISMKKRIVEIEETIENGNQKIFATFGDPLAEKLVDEEVEV